MVGNNNHTDNYISSDVYVFFIVMIAIDIMIYWYVPYVMPVCFFINCV